MFGKALGNLVGAGKKIVDETEQIDERFYADVMDELASGFKDKALVGKAIAQSDGNEAKFDSIYMKLRAKALQEEFQNKPTSEPQEVEGGKYVPYEDSQIIEKILRLKDVSYFLDLYNSELERERFSRASRFSLAHLKRDDLDYWYRLNTKDKKMSIVDENDKIIITYNLEEKIFQIKEDLKE